MKTPDVVYQTRAWWKNQRYHVASKNPRNKRKTVCGLWLNSLQKVSIEKTVSWEYYLCKNCRNFYSERLNEK